MVGPLSEAMEPLATRKNITILFALFAACVVVFQVLGRKMRQYSGGIATLDGQFYYSAEQAHATLRVLGPNGGRLYRYINLIDFLFPLIYSLLLSTSITYSLQRLFGRDAGLRRLNLLPWLGGCVDYLENVCIFALLTAYPRELRWLATVSSLLTATKWILDILALALASLGLLGSLVKGAFTRTTQPKLRTDPR